MTVVEMILANDESGGIGKDNKIPWKCKSDIDFFWKTINQHTIIVGRNTWEGAKKYFLKRRPTAKHIVVTSNIPTEDQYDNVIYVKSIEEALSFNDELMFVCGGSKIYDSMKNYVNMVIETEIDGTYDCDSFAPKWIKDMNILLTFDLPKSDSQPNAKVNIRYWRM